MPPLQALLALHAFWLVVLAPPVVFVSRWGTPWLLKGIGLSLAFLALTSLAYLIYGEVFCWCQEFQALRSYWPQRILFVVFTEADFPRMHLLLAGAIWLATALAKNRCHRDRQASADLTDHDAQTGDSHHRDPEPS